MLDSGRGGDDGGEGACGEVCFAALERENRKAARGWQIRSVVGWACWVRMYSRSSEGRAGASAIGVGDIAFVISVVQID